MPSNEKNNTPPSFLIDASLAEKTLEYWNFSSMYNERPSQYKKAITTENAFKLTNSIISVLGPHRRLAHNVIAVQEEIVMGRSKKNPQPATVTLLRQRG